MGVRMKKIYISTYCEWSSYGSVLQSLGLKSALNDIGCESTILKDVPFPKFKKNSFLKSLRSPKNTVKKILDIPFSKNEKQIFKKGTDFIKNNIDIEYFNSYGELCKSHPYADGYIAGSDQIWHPALCKEAFFLGFAPKNSKKISYAASMGVTEVPPENKEKFSRLLKNFNSYSVREKEMVPIVEEITGVIPAVHIDPTFLLPKDEWRAFQSKYKTAKPYILVYAIYWDKALNAQLKELHLKTRLPIISIQSSFRNIYSNKVLSDVGPAEFLWLVDHAEAVITSSFHGTAFSIIFNKKFSAVVNPKAKSRIESLLDTMEIKTPSPVNVISDFNVDYNSVNEKIKQEKKKSLDYLRSEIFGNQ